MLQTTETPCASIASHAAVRKTDDKYLIIGAGFVGLGMAQGLKAAGISYDQVDASDDIGGNWHHGVYESAHLISSRKMTQFPQFPMPQNYPDFPSARQMWEYLNAFVDHFELRQDIQLNCLVNYIRPVEQNLWEVTFETGEQHLYKGVLLCNGHHWAKKFPAFQGQFAGEIIHSKDYKHAEQLRGKRVLVIGAGNSACDIAAEAARVGAKCVMSLRESVWFLPKSFAGIPINDLAAAWLPASLQKLLAHIIIWLTFGKHSRYGLPQPQHKLFERHPTVNDEVPYYIKHGRITPRPEVKRLDGWEVEFVDGSRESFDLIVCATGFHVSYPFLHPDLQRVEGAVVNCHWGSFLDDYKGLYYIGWGQPHAVGVGMIIGTYSSMFVQLLQLDEMIKIPLGLVFKRMGSQFPRTHLIRGQELMKQFRLFKSFYPILSKKVQQIDSEYSDFQNQPLPYQPLPSKVEQGEKLTVF
jgi:hypothetical protein